MIEIPPPWQPPPADPPRSGRRSGRAVASAAIVAVVVVVLVVALINGHRSGNNQNAGSIQTQTVPPPVTVPSPGPSSGSGGGGGQGDVIPQVACPTIQDDQSKLAYNCIDNSLVQGDADTYLGLRISLSLNVEPTWVISEGSGNPLSVQQPPSILARFNQPHAAVEPVAATPTQAQIANEVTRRTDVALQAGYGDNPTAKTLSARTRNFAGVTGYELLTQVTINPTYRKAQGLKVKVERLWVVGLPTSAGISIFMLSIPDDRSDLWSKAEATVGTVHVL